MRYLISGLTADPASSIGADEHSLRLLDTGTLFCYPLRDNCFGVYWSICFLLNFLIVSDHVSTADDEFTACVVTQVDSFVVKIWYISAGH